jgi:hypothetical protein
MTPEMLLAKMLSSEPQVEKTASVEVDDLSEAKEKLAWADGVGRELARRDLEKVALPSMGSMLQGAKAALPGIGQKAKTLAGQGMIRTMQAGAGTRAAVGAGIGAGVGGIGGALKNPGVDPATGQQKSRLGNIATGMAGGAALGAGAGLAAKGAIRAAAGNKGAIGNATRGAMTQGGKANTLAKTVGPQPSLPVKPAPAPAAGQGTALGGPGAPNLTQMRQGR